MHACYGSYLCSLNSHEQDLYPFLGSMDVRDSEAKTITVPVFRIAVKYVAKSVVECFKEEPILLIKSPISLSSNSFKYFQDFVNKNHVCSNNFLAHKILRYVMVKIAIKP